jgi:peptide/nickel transport system substrate-binding protein
LNVKHGMGVLLVLLLISACTQSTPTQTAGSARSTSGPTSSLPTSVRIAVGSETDNFSTKLGGRTNAAEFNFLSNSPLVLLDEHGRPSPLLAVEQPSRDNGSWIVNPDGTMVTTWKIKPNAKWHDGQPVIAQDFVFAKTVYLDTAMTISDRTPEEMMDSVEVVDEKTFTIHWHLPYPRANMLIQRELEPLPSHILAPLYAAGDSDAFLNKRFWSGPDYVGNGPYKMVSRDPGNWVVYQAFPDYFMGKPAIENVIVRIMPDTTTIVANLLAGEIDTAAGATALGQHGGQTVREKWDQTGEGEVVATPTRFRYAQIQFNQAYLEQPALLDVRVRRAIAHGIDRDSLAQVVTNGASRVAEIFMIPDDPLYARADAAIAKYPFDTNRAFALLAEAGWTRRGDQLVNAAGEQFAVELRTTAETDNLTEMHIAGSDMTRLGMNITETVVQQARIRDAEYRIKFPGMNHTALSIGVPDTLRTALTVECPDPARRYAGSNRGCWSNLEFDRMYTIANTSLEASERDQAVVQALKILTEELGVIGFSRNSENIPIRKGLVGPGARWPGQIGNTWNVHNWHWTQS